MSKDHNHAIPVNSNSRSLWIALGLTSTCLIAEVIAGLVFNSLALLAGPLVFGAITSGRRSSTGVGVVG